MLLRVLNDASIKFTFPMGKKVATEMIVIMILLQNTKNQKSLRFQNTKTILNQLKLFVLTNFFSALIENNKKIA